MNELLRAYSQEECGEDGYPFAWHEETMAKEQHGHAGDGPILNPPIKDWIREQADHRCLRCSHPYPPGIAKTWHGGRYTPCDESCTHSTRQVALVIPPGGRLERDSPDAVRCAYYRILTVHHLDEDKANCRWWNLAALCQRCHLRMQRAVVMGRPYHYEHSDWFKPFAAGFYSWKYVGEDLTREETMAQLDDLLALEHRFTQEAIL